MDRREFLKNVGRYAGAAATGIAAIVIAPHLHDSSRLGEANAENLPGGQSYMRNNPERLEEQVQGYDGRTAQLADEVRNLLVEKFFDSATIKLVCPGIERKYAYLHAVESNGQKALEMHVIKDLNKKGEEAIDQILYSGRSGVLDRVLDLMKVYQSEVTMSLYTLDIEPYGRPQVWMGNGIHIGEPIDTNELHESEVEAIKQQYRTHLEAAKICLKEEAERMKTGRRREEEGTKKFLRERIEDF